MDFSFALENYYLNLLTLQCSFMTFAYLLYLILNNGSMVEFCWPFGFTFMSVQFLISGKGKLY